MDDLEKLLKKYQPSGPPSDLRERMMALADSPVAAGADGRAENGRPRGLGFASAQLGAVREWIVPLALVAATLLFYTLSGHVRERIAVHTTDVAEQARAAIVNDLATSLGGDDVARLEAERTMAMLDRLMGASAADSWMVLEPVVQ